MEAIEFDGTDGSADRIREWVAEHCRWLRVERNGSELIVFDRHTNDSFLWVQAGEFIGPGDTGVRKYKADDLEAVSA